MHQYPRPLAQIHADELALLPPEELAKLRYEWDLWCLPHQQEPDWERYDTWLQVGGRGSGKNTGVASWIRREVSDNGVRRINLIGRTSASVRDDMVCGEAGIIQAFPPHQRPVYISSQSLVRFHTGATALMLSAEEPESIQGKNAELAWCDEFSTYVRPEEVWSQVVLSTRVGKPKKAITSNWMPPCPFLESMVDDAERRRIHVVEASSFDNFANLPAPVQHEIQEMMLTEVGRAWVTGKRLQISGKFFRREWFRYLPVAPPGGRTVIAVDPSGTERGDETGIIVAKRVGDKGYVIADLSEPFSDRWAETVVDAYVKYRASVVVIERNRGLGFLRGCINPVAQQRRVTVNMKEIYSTRQKRDRALPARHLYELAAAGPEHVKIFHCPEHKTLEQMMTGWDPDTMEALSAKRKATSPDRIDALVFALSELGFHLEIARGLAPIHQKLPTNRI